MAGYAYLKLGTSGFNGRVTEIACCDEQGQIIFHQDVKLPAGVEISDGAKAVNRGQSEARQQKAKTFVDLVEQFEAAIAEKTLVMFNVHFVKEALTKEYTELVRELPANVTTKALRVNVLSLAKGVLQGKVADFKQSTLAEYFFVPHQYATKRSDPTHGAGVLALIHKELNKLVASHESIARGVRRMPYNVSLYGLPTKAIHPSAFSFFGEEPADPAKAQYVHDGANDIGMSGPG